jgi:hypothetical protein
LLLFTFKEYAAAHKYLLYINKAARNFNGWQNKKFLL